MVIRRYISRWLLLFSGNNRRYISRWLLLFSGNKKVISRWLLLFSGKYIFEVGVTL